MNIQLSCIFCEKERNYDGISSCKSCTNIILNIQIEPTELKLKISQVKLALKYNNRELALHLAHYLYAAFRKGYFQSLVFLSLLYFSEILKKRSIRLALYFLIKAVNKGDLNAYFILGNCYFQGHGIERNKEKALDLWSTAALLGHLNSERILLGKIPLIFTSYGLTLITSDSLETDNNF